MSSYFGRQLIEDTIAALSPMEPFPARSIYASDLAKPCLFYHTAKFLHWESKPLKEPKVRLMFEQGDDVERRALSHLRLGGWNILSTQRRFEWNNQGRMRIPIAGKVDAMISRGDDRRGVPVDFKGLQPYDADRLDPERGIDQFLQAKKPWLREYPGQILLYCLLGEYEEGCLHIYPKTNYGGAKTFWFRLSDHLEYTESLLARAEKIERLLQNGEVAPKLPMFDTCWCKWCDFLNLCQPDRTGGAGSSFINNPELEEEVKSYLASEEVGRDFNRLDRSLKAMFKPGGLYHREGIQIIGEGLMVEVIKNQRQVKGVLQDSWSVEFRILQ